jgi:hypothetical protein
MTSTEYAANLARAFMAAEIAMASANSEAAIVTCASRENARRLLRLRRTRRPLDREQSAGPPVLTRAQQELSES